MYSSCPSRFACPRLERKRNKRFFHVVFWLSANPLKGLVKKRDKLLPFLPLASLLFSPTPLQQTQLLLRGCVLRNTAWCLGVVVFSGGEAKVAMNATALPSKRSAVERRLDRLVAGVFALLGGLAGVNAAAGAYLSLDPRMWYLALGERAERALTRALFDIAANRALVAGTTFLTSVALYSSLIPISLYVTIELVKYAQAAVFVSGDRLMYDPGSDTPAAARTSNLNEDLGQVRWLLSDKTGTLTCNRMHFFGFSVAGEMYGGGGGGGEEEKGGAELPPPPPPPPLLLLLLPLLPLPLLLLPLPLLLLLLPLPLPPLLLPRLPRLPPSSPTPPCAPSSATPASAAAAPGCPSSRTPRRSRA